MKRTLVTEFTDVDVDSPELDPGLYEPGVGVQLA